MEASQSADVTFTNWQKCNNIGHAHVSRVPSVANKVFHKRLYFPRLHTCYPLAPSPLTTSHIETLTHIFHSLLAQGSNSITKRFQIKQREICFLAVTEEFGRDTSGNSVSLKQHSGN